VIPTHHPMIRQDMADQIYRTAEKNTRDLVDIRDCHQRGQPVLVGTVTIEASELLSGLLQNEKIPHQVLNAKHHEREAMIVAQAGRPGAVTIATNMAGPWHRHRAGAISRWEFKEIGDDSPKRQQARTDWDKRHQQVVAGRRLHVIGTERHESRRIDNQLRGRSGRQGDPGSSRFYPFAGRQSAAHFSAVTGFPVSCRSWACRRARRLSTWVSRAIENAQRKVEGRNFDIRKQLLEYDDVANDQRKVIYEQRNGS